MRIVVVEDEPKIREGLLKMIGKYTDYEIVGVGENGAEGLNIIRSCRPDLVISDIKMPQMDGLMMLEQMKQEKIETQVIILTGYSEFEYARRALQLQVVEYALKPLDVDGFMRTLGEVENRIKKIRMEKVSVEQLIWSYLSEPEDTALQILPLLRESLKINERVQSTLFLIRPHSLATETLKEIVRTTQERLEILCMENHHIFQIPQETGYCVLLVDTERNRNLKKVFQSRVLRDICRISTSRCSMAVMVDLMQLRETIGSLQELLKFSFSFPQGTIIDSYLAEHTTYQELQYPDCLEQQIIRNIRSGHREKIMADGQSFREKVIESEGDPECIHEYTLRFAACILRVAGDIRGNLAKETGIPYIMNGIASSESKDEMSYQFEKIINAIAKEEEEFVITENGMILNVLTFIRENYRQEITLTDAASCCGVTPEYLSRVFTHEMGVNYTSFLQNFRVSIAKQLLLSGKYKVYEVSEAVGFHDQKYFTKVFKKLCGVSPAEYKRENVR